MKKIVKVIRSDEMRGEIDHQRIIGNWGQESHAKGKLCDILAMKCIPLQGVVWN
jgi:hypothetical protein